MSAKKVLPKKTSDKKRPKRKVSLLRAFAREHNLKVEKYESMDEDERDWKFDHILIGDRVSISDMAEQLHPKSWYYAWTEKRRERLRNKLEKEKLLEFTVFPEHTGRMYDLIRFSAHYFTHPQEAQDLNDIAWGKILPALGIEFHEDRECLTFLFPANRPEAVAMVLLLARMPFAKGE